MTTAAVVAVGLRWRWWGGGGRRGGGGGGGGFGGGARLERDLPPPEVPAAGQGWMVTRAPAGPGERGGDCGRRGPGGRRPEGPGGGRRPGGGPGGAGRRSRWWTRPATWRTGWPRWRGPRRWRTEWPARQRRTSAIWRKARGARTRDRRGTSARRPQRRTTARACAPIQRARWRRRRTRSARRRWPARWRRRWRRRSARGRWWRRPEARRQGLAHRLRDFSRPSP